MKYSKGFWQSIYQDYFNGYFVKELVEKYKVPFGTIIKQLWRKGFQRNRYEFARLLHIKRADAFKLENNGMWKGGISSANGYKILRIGKKKYRAEHILKAEIALGRSLKMGEIVHHIDCNLKNNKNSNLLICNRSFHKFIHDRMSRYMREKLFGIRMETLEEHWDGHYFRMWNGSRMIPIHRVIGEKALGRELKRSEIVHHINGNVTDNRNENLLICSNAYHRQIHWRMSNMFGRLYNVPI